MAGSRPTGADCRPGAEASAAPMEDLLDRVHHLAQPGRRLLRCRRRNRLARTSCRRGPGPRRGGLALIHELREYQRRQEQQRLLGLMKIQATLLADLLRRLRMVTTEQVAEQAARHAGESAER